MKPQDIEWSRRQFAIVKDGGTWCVPRTALFWERRGEKLVLVGRMPWHKDLPMTAEQWKKKQDDDVAIISEHMRAAGVEVQQ